jgi:hypothetical protein
MFEIISEEIEKAREAYIVTENIDVINENKNKIEQLNINYYYL